MIKQFVDARLQAVLKDYEAVKITGKRSAKIYGDCERILQELLRGEFKGLKESVFIVLVEKTADSFDAQLRWVLPDIWLIVIHIRNWNRDEGFSENGGLRNLLRHELLHLETKWPDDNRLFRCELQSRQIYH